MMATENDAEIQEELPLEAEQELESAVDPAPAEATEAAKPDELAELKKQLEAANRRAQDAEERVSSLAAEKSHSDTRVQSEVSQRFQAQEQAVDSRIKAAESGLTSAKAEMVRAQQEARFEDAANHAESIADHKTELKAATWEKNQIAQQKTRMAAEVERQAAQPPNLEEAFLTRIPGAPSKQWLKDHPDILRAVAFNPNGPQAKRLFGAAQSAEGEGHAPDSAAYFDFIEQSLGLKTEEDSMPPAKPQARQPGRTAAAAPTSRSSPSAAPRVMKLDEVVRRLTPTDRANARISFPDKKEDDALKLFAEGLVKAKQKEPNFRPDIRLN